MCFWLGVSLQTPPPLSCAAAYPPTVFVSMDRDAEQRVKIQQSYEILKARGSPVGIIKVRSGGGVCEGAWHCVCELGCDACA